MKTCKVNKIAVQEYIKERYGVNMGYEQICSVCKEHFDAGERCDCSERRKQAVTLIRECLENEASCVMNLETLDHVYFENASVQKGSSDSIKVFCAGRFVNVDLDAVLEAKVIR